MCKAAAPTPRAADSCVNPNKAGGVSPRPCQWSPSSHSTSLAIVRVDGFHRLGHLAKSNCKANSEPMKPSPGGQRWDQCLLHIATTATATCISPTSKAKSAWIF